MKELNNFQDIKDFIKNFIIEDSELFKLIYFPNSFPNDNDFPDTPYEIFEPSEAHGCVLFRPKNDIVQSKEGTNVLIFFNSVNYNTILDDLYITFSVICKGVNVQELADSTNRISTIANHIDNRFNMAVINDISKIKRMSFKPLSLNEENSGMLITYHCRTLAYNPLDNVNYLQKHYGVDSREYL